MKDNKDKYAPLLKYFQIRNFKEFPINSLYYSYLIVGLWIGPIHIIPYN